MSHKATNWAVTVRGIPPAAKVVLWHLADRHNKDSGRCNPSQAKLAEDVEMSRSSLNNQLALLEQRGLIKRVKTVDPKTKRQKSTHYILCMDVTEAQEPCPKSGHGAVSKSEAELCPNSGPSRVQNLDTNPVIEPGKEPRVCARVDASANRGPPASPADSGRADRSEDIQKLIAELNRKAGHGRKGIERRVDFE